ncbi:MAG: DUF2577 domain-containing protein [Clostridia bacterium]|nr:DUF2577 domain-containing protein [Clostridia bacterium]
MATMNTSGNETSLKQILQSMSVGGIEFLQGTVISVSPLKIQITNDEKLIINERITIVPWHLTDHTTQATYTVGGGALDSETNVVASHSHKLVTYTLTRGTLTVHNALKVGEKIHVLSLNNGKKYYVLDRVVS